MEIISLGLGVQSTAMYFMSSTGELPRADFAIFADPGREKKLTIAYLKYLQKWAAENNGIPIVVTRAKNLYRDLLKGQNSRGKAFAPIPAFTKGGNGADGMLKRQCTGEYKIEMVNAAIRRIAQVKTLRGVAVTVWKGITTDEIDRMSIPQENWCTHFYPFCGYSVRNDGPVKGDLSFLRSRVDLVLWYERKCLPLPPKSSCVFCPYQPDSAWYEMKKNSPSDFRAAVRVDRAIRNSSNMGEGGRIYLHRDCVPLESIEFAPGLPDLWAGDCLDNCHI